MLPYARKIKHVFNGIDPEYNSFIILRRNDFQALRQKVSQLKFRIRFHKVNCHN